MKNEKENDPPEKEASSLSLPLSRISTSQSRKNQCWVGNFLENFSVQKNRRRRRKQFSLSLFSFFSLSSCCDG
jgi:hypothetical protein